MTSPNQQDVAALVARLEERWESSASPVTKKINRLLATCREAATALSTLAAERDRQKQEADDLRKVLVDSLESDRQTRLAMDAAINPNGEKRDFIPAARELHAALLASEARATALEGKRARLDTAYEALKGVARSHLRSLLASEAQLARAREALRFYASSGDYVAPYTGGRGKLYFDCGTVAREALRDLPAPADGRGEVDLREGWLKRDTDKASERVKEWDATPIDPPTEAREDGGKCRTCDGHGLIGGWRVGDGYDAEPCPDCTAQTGDE